ncbi:putative fungistatic metabolite [Colletotrichum sp. SAR 10_70]|nr:putative fungistatic metabolite [Colletotrichum sp. SAR 10_70]
MAKSTHFFGLGSAVLLALQAQTVISVPFNGPRAVSLPAQHGYTYQGCYMEPSNGRALETVTGSDGLTLGACADICAAAGKAYFGAECGSKLSAAATLAADDTECSFACPGNGFQKCGAGNRLSVYKNENIVTPAGPSAKAKAGSYVSAGCYSDLVQGQRALVRTRADDAMTPDMCATFCAGSAWMGVEYGKECWCGNVLGSLSLPATQQTDCNMACAGDSTSLCGGPARLNMYTLDTANGVSSANSAPSVAPSAASTAVDRVGDFIHLGCWTDDAANGRTFGDLYASDDMTIKKCADWAISKGYLNFGIEYSRECWAGNTVNPLATSAGSSTCNMKCMGDASQSCGGPNRLDMYKYSPAPSSTSSAGAPSTSSTASGSSTSSTLPSANSAPNDATLPHAVSASLAGATIGDNSQLQTVDGKTVVDLTPPDNGQASVTVAAASAPDLQSEDSVVVQLTYKTEALKKRATKRAVLSECTLTMMIGSTVIYSSRIWTTDGSYTTVTSMPTSAGITTLIIVQYCPATAVPIVIGDVAVAPAPSSSSASSSSTVIVSSTVVIIQATPSTPSTSSSRLSSTISNAGWATYIPPATTNAPSTTAAPAATNAAANVPTYLAGVYQAGTCSSPGYMSTCTMSGMPVATIDIVGKATASPVPASGNMQQAYEQCAGICANLDSCNSWALDRGVGVYPDATASIWWCYFYSGQVGKYHPNAYNAQFAAVVYFAKTCYSCQQRDLAALAPAPAAATTSTTSSSSTSVPAVTQAPVIPGVLTFSAPAYDSAACTFGTPPDCYLSGAPVATSGLLAVATGITGFVSSEGPFKHSTKAVRPGAITPFSWIPTLAVPTTVTETNCPRPTADNWYTAGCTLSGGVLQTSGLVAVATGVPAPRVQNSNLFEYAYQACAQMCASMSTCYSWALDRGFWPADYSDWTCYFYSAGARLMTPQNDGNYWIVWMDKQCYACSTPAAAISSPTPSTSSSIAPAATSSSNAVSSTSSAASWTSIAASSTHNANAASSTSSTVSPTTAAPATTRPPSEAYVFSASAWTSGTCVTQRNNDGATPCALSGWPTPTSQSGLLAVATGIAPAPSGVFDFSKPFEVCAGACRGVNGCTTWAIDRGNWPTDLSPWSCYMYNFVNSSNYNLPGNYFRLTSYGSAYAKFAWGVTECYNCTLNQAIASSVSSSYRLICDEHLVQQQSFFDLLHNFRTIWNSHRPRHHFSSSRHSDNILRAGVDHVLRSTDRGSMGLIAVATGIAPNVLGDYNFDPSYQRCAVICAGISGCQGYALDRTSTVSWNCNFYSLPVMTLLKSLSPSVDYRPVVWMSMLCHNCANIVPANVLSSSSSSFSSSSSSSSSLPLFVGYPQATASPTSTTPASSKSQSAASSSTSAAAAVCSRAASPPATANCNVKGFQQPAGGVQGSYLYAQTDCAAYCLSLGAACKSWTWVPGSGWCGIYSLAVWDAIGDSAVAGRAYKDNVMDEPACWSCPDGAAAHYLPV